MNYESPTTLHHDTTAARRDRRTAAPSAVAGLQKARQSESWSAALGAMAVTLVVCLGLQPLPADDVATLIQHITSDDKEVRHRARTIDAARCGSAAVAPLGKLLRDDRREVAISAERALQTLTHHAARPQAPDEARAVSVELGRLLHDAAPRKVKLIALNLLSYVGGAEAVPHVAGVLRDDDKHVRESARLALERIPVARATEALIRAAKSADPKTASDYLFSIAKHRNPEAIPFLLSQSQADAQEVRLSALKGLAMLAATSSIEAFEAEITRTDGAVQAEVFREYLRLADEISAKGDAAAAKRVYERALTSAPLDYQRERALEHLTRIENAASLESLLVGLADPADRVRRLAIARLSARSGSDVTSRLRREYEGSQGEKRVFLLRALAERDPEGSRALIERAVLSRDPEVRVTALDLTGKLLDPTLESTFLELARSGSGSVRPTAVSAYLALAAHKLQLPTPPRAEVSAMYANSLEFASTDEQLAAAIAGLQDVGDTSAVEQLVPFLRHAVVGGDAARVFVDLTVRLVDAGEVDRAEQLLLNILSGQFPQELKEKAVDKLTSAGRNPQRQAIADGFLFDWWLIGPIPADDDTALTTKFFPEESREFDKIHNIGPRRFRWQRPRILSTNGEIDLLPRFRRSRQRLAYAYTEIVSDSDQDVVFKLGTNDGCVLWLNDEKIHAHLLPRGLMVDQDTVKARLKAGKNTLLLKVHNLGGNWGFAFRSMTPADEPLVLRSALPPPQGK